MRSKTVIKEKLVSFILIFFFLCFFGASQEKEQRAKKEKFMQAKDGEYWRINDDYTRVLSEPDSSYDDWRFIFRNKYSLTWDDLFHTIDIIGKFKCVFVIQTEGHLERWKYVKYGEFEKGVIRLKFGWILGTTVEDAENINKKFLNLNSNI